MKEASFLVSTVRCFLRLLSVVSSQGRKKRLLHLDSFSLTFQKSSSPVPLHIVLLHQLTLVALNVDHIYYLPVLCNNSHCLNKRRNIFGKKDSHYGPFKRILFGNVFKKFWEKCIKLYTLILKLFYPLFGFIKSGFVRYIIPQMIWVYMYQAMRR